VLERTWQLVTASRLLVQGRDAGGSRRAIDVRGKLSCGRDVEIDIGCIFAGRGDTGKQRASGCLQCDQECQHRRGHRNRTIQFTSIAAKWELTATSVHMPRLRPGTKLHDGVHIGNFVEVKKQ